MRTYTLAGALILLLIIVCYKNIAKEDIKKYLSWFLIGVFVMAVQLVAHAKSLMWQRYIIPYIVGYAMVFLLLGYRFFEKDIVHRVIFSGIWAVVLIRVVPAAWQGAENYAADGQITRQVIQCALDYTDENDLVIAAFRDEELNIATECRMEIEGRTQTYSRVDGEWKNEVQLSGALSEEMSWDHARAVLCYSWQLENILEAMGGQVSYEFYDFDGYGIMIIDDESRSAS